LELEVSLACRSLPRKAEPFLLRNMENNALSTVSPNRPRQYWGPEMVSWRAQEAIIRSQISANDTPLCLGIRRGCVRRVRFTRASDRELLVGRRGDVDTWGKYDWLSPVIADQFVCAQCGYRAISTKTGRTAFCKCTGSGPDTSGFCIPGYVPALQYGART